MDRRRFRFQFVPMSDVLESRQLLSAATVSTSSASSSVSSNGRTVLTTESRSSVTPPNSAPTQVSASTRFNLNVNSGLGSDTNSARLHERRIDNLPFFLEKMGGDRNLTLPTELVQRLQDDLRALQGTLTQRPKAALEQFNSTLRGPIGSRSIQRHDAISLNQAIGQALTSAGADSRAVLNLQNDLLELSRFNSNYARSAELTANNYSLIAQVALGVGRSIPVRAVPAGPAGAFR